jgi:hypothetical protein
MADCFRIQLNMRDFMSTKAWLFDFLSGSTNLEATLLALSFWHIWEARNDVPNNVDLIVHHCYHPKPIHSRETTAPRKWSPPPPGRVLVNVDAALFDNFSVWLREW